MASRENVDITHLIRRWQKGDKDAEEPLFAALYDALHTLALHCLKREAPGRTLGATALVHEAYLRFCRAESLNIVDRQHFFALASRVMRRILVDKARARQARPRLEPAAEGNDARIVREDIEAEEILALDRALSELSRQSQRQAQLVELKYFGGYSLEDCAALLGVSEKTAQRDWQIARVRLRSAIDGTV
jgi:RNA polymerase sigma factor (TIGR02999 family)